MGFLLVSVFVCLANILVFYFSTIRTDIDMEFIHATYKVIFFTLTISVNLPPPPYNSKPQLKKSEFVKLQTLNKK